LDDEVPVFAYEDSNLVDEDSKSEDKASKFSDEDSKLNDVDSVLNDVAPIFSDVNSILYNVDPKTNDVDSIYSDEAPNFYFKDSNSKVKYSYWKVKDSNSTPRDWAGNCRRRILVLKASSFHWKSRIALLRLSFGCYNLRKPP
jgi:hypothetical protein